MKKTYVNVVANRGAVTASQESSKSRLDRLLTVDDLGAWLQVKPRTVYQWVHEGYIPAVKLGTLVRFDQDSIIEWVKKREAPGRSSKRLNIDV